SHLGEETFMSRRLERLTSKRTRPIDYYLHSAGRRLMDLPEAKNTGRMVIGKNPLWQRGVHLRKRTNQHFLSVPHARFIEMLTYEAALASIQVSVIVESSTSKASFLDADPLPVYEAMRLSPTFSGQRVKRGWYRAADGTRIHADVNGAYNIMRQGAPEAFAQGSSGCVVHRKRLAV